MNINCRKCGRDPQGGHGPECEPAESIVPERVSDEDLSEIERLDEEMRTAGTGTIEKYAAYGELSRRSPTEAISSLVARLIADANEESERLEAEIAACPNVDAHLGEDR